MRHLAPLACLSLLAGCGAASSRTITLRPEAAAVQIVTDRPAARCDALGDVLGQFTAEDAAQAVKGARIDVRNKARAMGADVVLLQTTNTSRDIDPSPFGPVAGAHHVVVAGTALRCNVPAQRPSVAAPTDVHAL